MEGVLVRIHEDRGLRQLPDDILAFRVMSYIKILDAEGIAASDYDMVYEMATMIYNSQEIKGPFGVDYMVQAAKQLKESRIKYKVFEKPTHKRLASCTACQGTKISFKKIGGKPFRINRNEDGTIKRCDNCE